MKREILPLLAFCLVGTITVVHAVGKITFGRCPNVKSKPSFDMTRFAGIWYVVYTLDIPIECQVEVYIKSSENLINLWRPSDIKKNHLQKIKNWGHRLNGTVSDYFIFDQYELSVDESDPAHMTRKKWLIRTKHFYVVDTDYENYAVTFECESFLVVRTQKAYILWKYLPWDDTVLDNVKKKMETYNVHDDDWFRVNHRSCLK